MFKYGRDNMTVARELKQFPFSFREHGSFPRFADPKSTSNKKDFLRDYLGDSLVDTSVISCREIAEYIFKTQITPVLEAHESYSDINMNFNSNPIIQSCRLGKSKLSRDPGLRHALNGLQKQIPYPKVPFGIQECFPLPPFVDMCKIAYALSKYPEKEISITISGSENHILRLGQSNRGDIRNTCYEGLFRKRSIVEHEKAVTVWGSVDNNKLFRCWGFIDTYEVCMTNFYSVEHLVNGSYLHCCHTFPKIVLGAYISKHFDLTNIYPLDTEGFEDRFNESVRDRYSRCPYINSGSSVQYTN